MVLIQARRTSDVVTKNNLRGGFDSVDRWLFWRGVIRCSGCWQPQQHAGKDHGQEASASTEHITLAPRRKQIKSNADENVEWSTESKSHTAWPARQATQTGVTTDLCAYLFELPLRPTFSPNLSKENFDEQNDETYRVFVAGFHSVNRKLARRAVIRCCDCWSGQHS
jgi:hypothetical protein